MSKLRIFVSYSHLDARWVRDLPQGPTEPEDLAKYPHFLPWLARHLAQDDVVFWYDQALQGEPGEAFAPKIKAEIDQADLAALLISENFVGSDFIRNFELPPIKARLEAGQMSIIPILVGPVDWDNLGELQWLLPLQIIPGRPTPLVEYIADVAAYEQVRVDILSSVRNRLRKLRTGAEEVGDRSQAAPDPAPVQAASIAREPAPPDVGRDANDKNGQGAGGQVGDSKAAARRTEKLHRLRDELRKRLAGEADADVLAVVRAILALDPLDEAALDARATVAESTAGEVLRLEGHKTIVRCVGFAPDGAHAFSGDRSGYVRLWDLYAGLETQCLRASDEAVTAARWLPDGDKIVTGSPGQGLVVLWDVATGEELSRTLCGPAARLALSPDGTQALTAESGGRVVQVWDVQTGEVCDELHGATAEVRCMAISHDGAYALSGDKDGWLRMWDLDLGIEVWRTELATSGTNRTDPCVAAVFSRDGCHWAASAGPRVQWGRDVSTPGGVLTGRGIGRTVLSLDCSPDGQALLSTTDAGTIYVVWAEDSIKPREFQPHRVPVRAAAISPTGRRALSGDDGGHVIYWSL